MGCRMEDNFRKSERGIAQTINHETLKISFTVYVHIGCKIYRS